MKLAAILFMCVVGMPAQPAPDSIKLDNEFVRVSFLTDQPRTKTPLHRHEFNRVMIYLDPMELVLRYQDGQVDHQRWSKGQVAWSPGGRLHTGENLIDHTARVVEVELKKTPSGKPPVATGRDPLKVNRKNVKVEFENEYVRVLRCKYLANVREPLHEHTNDGRLTVALDDVVLKVTTQGAEDRTVTLGAGEASWSVGPVVHAAQANRAVDLIVLELK
jgi:hypothetical protein